jgi:hypothetical protein
MRNLVLFGAGASIEYGAPSTPELTRIIEQGVHSDRWMQRCGGDAAYDKIQNALRGYLSGDVNFEQIYHCVHELAFLQPTSGAADEFKPLLGGLVADTTGAPREALQPLAHKIIEIIFRYLSDRCTSPKVTLEPLVILLNRLTSEGLTRIYSTNYDDFIWQARSDLYTGFPTGGTDAKRFDAADFWKQTGQNSLFHLHGSVHMGFSTPDCGEFGELFWYDDRKQAERHAFYHGGPRSRMDGSSFMPTAVITGLDKLSRLQQRPLSYYYSALSLDAMSADAIYVIGSGLADLHLNTWLHEARSKSPRTPLIFVDHMHGGLANHLDDVNAKTKQLFHSLEVHITRAMPGRSITPGWTISNDETAAIYDNGFQNFLNTPGDLAKARAALGL